jgi:hypothetical protein
LRLTFFFFTANKKHSKCKNKDEVSHDRNLKGQDTQNPFKFFDG